MKVKLKRAGSLYKLEPWVPGLEPLLSYKYRKFSYDNGKHKIEVSNEKLYTIDEKGDGVFPAGLYSRVAKFLDGRGIEHDLEDFRDLKKLYPFPDFAKVGQLREGQDRLLLAVAEHDGGLLVGGTGLGKSWLIRQVCKMYPTLNIVVTSPRIPVIKTLYDELKKELPWGTVGLITTGTCEQHRRVTLCTSKSLLRTDVHKCQLLMFDEAHGVGHNQTAEDVGAFVNARKFGFTATPKGRGDNAELVAEALFGPPLVTIDYEEAVSTGLVVPLEVQMIALPACYVPPVDQPIARKRHGYWRNNVRNMVIANVAKTFPDDEQVLIMVETLEHALYLHKQLPNFQVVYYGGEIRKIYGIPDAWKYKKDSKALAKMRKDFSSGYLKKVIATTSWREGVDFPKLAVLIRADGITSSISSTQIPGRLSRLSSGKDKGILIDFDDNWDGWSKGRAAARMATYKKIGWPITKVQNGAGSNTSQGTQAADCSQPLLCGESPEVVSPGWGVVSEARPEEDPVCQLFQLHS